MFSLWACDFFLVAVSVAIVLWPIAWAYRGPNTIVNQHMTSER